MRRKILLAVIAVLLVLVAAVTAYWWIAADRLGDGIARWRDDARAQGLTADFADPGFGGWPLRLTATFQAPLLGLPGGQRWQGPPVVTGYAWLWDPQLLHFEAPGRHSFTLPRGQLLLDADTADATVRLRRGLIDAVTLALRQAVLSNAANGGQSLSADSLTLSLDSLLPTEQPDGPRNAYAVDFTLDLRGAPMPANARLMTTLLGPTLETLVLQGQVRGMLAGGDLQTIARVWRDSGGVLDLAQIDIVWGDVSIKGNGSLALDDAFRPLGAFSLETRGLIELVQRLSDAGLLDRDRALAVTVGLAALSTGRDDKGLSIVKLPITMQDGKLFLGRIPLGELRPLI